MQCFFGIGVMGIYALLCWTLASSVLQETFAEINLFQNMVFDRLGRNTTHSNISLDGNGTVVAFTVITPIPLLISFLYSLYFVLNIKANGRNINASKQARTASNSRNPRFAYVSYLYGWIGGAFMGLTFASVILNNFFTVHFHSLSKDLTNISLVPIQELTLKLYLFVGVSLFVWLVSPLSRKSLAIRISIVRNFYFSSKTVASAQEEIELRPIAVSTSRNMPLQAPFVREFSSTVLLNDPGMQNEHSVENINQRDPAYLQRSNPRIIPADGTEKTKFSVFEP
jgi:hypothetical protein